MLKRIAYISRFARPMSKAELTRLAEQASRRNQELGITGLLMTSGGIFYQIIEGPRDAIDELYQKIARDPRHVDVLLLSVQEDSGERQFPSWSMKKIDLDADSSLRLGPIKALLEAIVAQREMIERLMQILSKAIWQELMT